MNKKKNLILALFILLASFLIAGKVTFAFSFAVVGDSRGSGGSRNSDLGKAVRQIAKKTQGPVFPLGDEVNSCYGDLKCSKDFKKWKMAMGNLLSRTYPIMGNHDRSNGKADATWQKSFSNLPENGPDGFQKLTYSFDYGEGHFVILDSERPGHKINQVQRDWLENDLTNNTQKYTFVFFHEPAFAISKEVSDALDAFPVERNAFWSIIDKHNVTAVFVGHEHLYGRKKIGSSIFPGAQNTIYQFTVGNTDVAKWDQARAGLSEYSYQGHTFVIVSADNNQITVNLYKVGGKLVNSFSFSK